MRNSVRHFYDFGPFRLDPEKRRLLREGEPVSLSPKAVDALIVLVQNAGRLLERDALMEAVWADSFIEDANLTVAISHLRKALGQKGDAAEYIETIPRVGYRFVAEVRSVIEELTPLVIQKHTLSRTVIEEEFDETSGKEEPMPADLSPPTLTLPRLVFRRSTVSLLACAVLIAVVIGTAIQLKRNNRNNGIASSVMPASIRSIVVLPPRPLTGEADNASLSLGMADTLITRLGSVRQLVVRPTSAVVRYLGTNQDALEVGRAVGVDAVLDGSLQRESGRVRVTLRMIRVSDGAQVWTGSFDEADANIFKLQDSISQQVAGALFRDLSLNEKAILSRQQTTNAEAYACYLKGNYFWSKRGVEAGKALEYFRCAIELDPGFAEAYVGLATVDAASLPIPSPETEALIERALQLDGSLAEAHATKGLIKMFHHWDWAAAETELDRAIELNPNSVSAHHWKGVYFSLRGRLDEAKAEMHRALELDPLSLIVMADLGQVYYFAHEYDQALDYCNRALALDATFQISHEYLFDIYREKRMEREALNEMAQFEHPDATAETVARARDNYFKAGFQNTLKKHIEGFLSTNEPKLSAIRIAQYYIDLGNYEQALHWLATTPEKPNFLLPFMNVDPIYDPIRSDPRFQSLLERMNLKQSKS